MSEENKEIVRRSYEEITAGHISAFDTYFASDIVYHGSGEMELQGIDGLKEYASMYVSAFSDLKTEIHDQAAEGDKVWTRATHVGTHTGDLQGIAPTGKGISDCIDERSPSGRGQDCRNVGPHRRHGDDAAAWSYSCAGNGVVDSPGTRGRSRANPGRFRGSSALPL